MGIGMGPFFGQILVVQDGMGFIFEDLKDELTTVRPLYRSPGYSVWHYTEQSSSFCYAEALQSEYVHILHPRQGDGIHSS